VNRLTGPTKAKRADRKGGASNFGIRAVLAANWGRGKEGIWDCSGCTDDKHGSVGTDWSSGLGKNGTEQKKEWFKKEGGYP